MDYSEKRRKHSLTCHEGGREEIERELVELLLRPGPTPKYDLERLMKLLDPGEGKLSIAYARGT